MSASAAESWGCLFYKNVLLIMVLAITSAPWHFHRRRESHDSPWTYSAGCGTPSFFSLELRLWRSYRLTGAGGTAGVGYSGLRRWRLYPYNGRCRRCTRFAQPATTRQNLFVGACNSGDAYHVMRGQVCRCVGKMVMDLCCCCWSVMDKERSRRAVGILPVK